MMDLDWALANMDGKLKKPTKGVSSEWIKEAETKGGNDVCLYVVLMCMAG